MKCRDFHQRSNDTKRIKHQFVVANRLFIERMMFWRSPSTASPKKDACKNSSRKDVKPREVHHFHNNPAKSWSYYDKVAQSELNSLLIQVPKKETSSTAESSTWSASVEQLLQEEEAIVDDDDLNNYFLCPEGVTRVPFSAWEVDLLGTSRRSSYFQGNVSAYLPKRTNNKELSRDNKKLKSFSPRHTVHSSATSTPNNSPRL